jgi:hypothetical protein
MMNVGIIFYAARETGDRMLRDIAVRHALTTRRVLVRGDGSTAHEGIFDLETGEFLRQSTQQGFRADSSGRFTDSATAMSTVTIRGFSRLLRPARITTSLTHRPTAYLRGISTRRSRRANYWTPRQRLLPRRVFSGSAA